MARRSRQNPQIREFILNNVADHPNSIGSLAVKKFGVSRTTISRYMNRLADENLITATGHTKARQYKLKNFVEVLFNFEEITASSDEDTVWRFRILPYIHDLKQNILNICHYGFTEILNNVIDHSVSDDAMISYEQNYFNVSILIVDHGIGIFEKIQRDFNLPDARSALLELSKGKLTSDESRHSGEGIFFSSRMFDHFSIHSGNLFYTRERKGGHKWLVETGPISNFVSGTIVKMDISTKADWTTRGVFNEYQGDNLRFRRTHIPIKLSNYPGEQLVSRSQAKRVLTRFENFSEVILDFEGVEDIGQAFADEIFRVFKNGHPQIKLMTINANQNIEQMIEHVFAQAWEKTPSPE